MTLSRYEKLLQSLHLNNTRSVPRGDPAYDKLFKVRPLVEKMKKKFQEVMNPSPLLLKDRSSMNQYMLLTPTKRGYKV